MMKTISILLTAVSLLLVSSIGAQDANPPSGSFDNDPYSKVDSVPLEDYGDLLKMIEDNEINADIKAKSAKTAILFSRPNPLLSLPILLTLFAAQTLF